jgi:hypothetical protein
MHTLLDVIVHTSEQRTLVVCDLLAAVRARHARQLAKRDERLLDRIILNHTLRAYVQTKKIRFRWNGGMIDVRPEVGRAIFVDTWDMGHCPQHLEPCELPEMAPFRLQSSRYTDIKYMCRVEITGRTTQRRPYDDREWVRVRIVFVGDGEPDTICPGWMVV